MRIHKHIYILAFLLFQAFAIAQEKNDLIVKPTIKGSVLKSGLTNYFIKNKGFNPQVSELWKPFYDRKNCWFDFSNDVQVCLFKNGVNVGCKTYKVDYGTGRYTSKTSKKGITYPLTIKTNPREVNRKNTEIVDDFQYVINTQQSELLIVYGVFIVEIVDLTKLSGTRNTFIGKREDDRCEVVINMGECVIVN